MDDQITPGPWKWVLMGSAGNYNYYLVGNNGKGPVTHSGPDCADGRLKEAAPALLTVLTEGIGIPESPNFASDLETIANFLKVYHPAAAGDLRRKAQSIRAAIAAAKGEARR